MTALAEAAKTFEQTLGELGITGDEREVDPSALGRRAALLAASDLVWHKHLGPLYSSKQVRDVMGRGTRQSVSELAKRGRLLALPEADGRLAFPAFQFTRTGERLPGLERILKVFAGAVETPYTIASWFGVTGYPPAVLFAVGALFVIIVLLHYSPTQTTLEGEPRGIWPFLGTDRLAGPIAEHRPDVVLHGHTHAGSFEGAIGDVPVFNVAVPVLGRDFFVFELDGASVKAAA